MPTQVRTAMRLDLLIEKATCAHCVGSRVSLSFLVCPENGTAEGRHIGAFSVPQSALPRFRGAHQRLLLSTRTQRGVADRCQCEIRVVGQEINSNHSCAFRTHTFL